MFFPEDIEAERRRRRRAKKIALRAQMSTQDPEVVKSKCDRLSQENLASSAFLRLPAELRNDIYDYCISQNPVWDSSPVFCSNPSGLPALAQVCRQTYKEFAPIFFSRTQFDVHYLTMAVDFARALSPEHRQIVKCLVLMADQWEQPMGDCTTVADYSQSVYLGPSVSRANLSVFPSLEVIYVNIFIYFPNDKDVTEALRFYFGKSELEVRFGWPSRYYTCEGVQVGI